MTFLKAPPNPQDSILAGKAITVEAAVDAPSPLECEVCLWLAPGQDHRDPPCRGSLLCKMKLMRQGWGF